MKYVPILLLIMLFTVSIGLAQDSSDEWVTIKKSQLMEWRDHILELQSTVEMYSVNIMELELKVMKLQNESLMWRNKYNSVRRGFWIGMSSGYPLGAQGIALYQFNERIGVFVVGGYSSSWSINAGFIARISK